MEMNQFYNSGAVQHSGVYSQHYSAYNSWASECVKNGQNYNNNSVMFGDNFNNCLGQSNEFFQYNQMPQSNSMSQGPTVPLPNQNPVIPNKANIEKSDSEDSPALRALLTNPVKKIKYTPNYYSSITQPSQSEEYKINQIKEALTSVECPIKPTTASTRKQLTPILDSAVLSPQSSEPEYNSEYLNYTSISQSIPKDGFSSPTMSTTPSVLSEINAGSPFEISPPPSASSVASTISNSPPPSPIGQKFALSSQNMTPSSWLPPNGTGPQVPMNNLSQQLWMSNKDADSYLGDEKQGSKRSRQTYSRSQTHMLELSFFKSTYLSRQRRSELSKELNLTERQVKIWFQNRRMKEKKVKGTPAEKKSPPQPQFIGQPPLGYTTKSPSSTTAVTAPYQPPSGYQAHHNSLGVPRPPISHNMPGQPGFNMVPPAPIPGQFIPPSYDAFSKRNTLQTGMENHFPQQPFGANQYPQFHYPHQNSHNYLAPTCNYGQYPIRTSNMASSTDYPIVAPNVFAG